MKPLSGMKIDGAPGQAMEGAAEREIDEYWTYLRLVANRAISTELRQRVGASDVVQDTLLAAHRDRHKFRGRTELELRQWLVRILSCNILDAEKALRRRCRDAGREIKRDDASAELAVVDPQLTPCRGAQRNESHLALFNALDRLPAHYREVVMLRATEGLSLVEIAQRTGKSSEATRHIWVRAIKQLAQQLHTNA